MDEERHLYDRAVSAIADSRIDVEYFLSLIATRPKIIHCRYCSARTLLDHAVDRLRPDIVQELIRLGSALDQREKPIPDRGRSALRWAVSNTNSDDRWDILEMLMNAGADPNLIDEDGLSAMFAVSRNPSRDDIMLFKQHGFAPDLNSLMYLVPFEQYQQTVSGKLEDLSPFCLAVNGLLTCAVSIAKRDPDKSLRLVEFFLELGLDPNADATPFQQPLAESLQDTPVAPKIAAMLLAKGADPSVRDRNGVHVVRLCETYVKYSKKRGEDASHLEEFEELLMQYGGKRYG